MRGVQAPRATPVRGWRNYRVAKSHSWLRAVVLSTLRVFDLRHATSCIIPRALRLRDQTVAKPSRNHLSSLPLPLPLCCASVFEWVRGTRVYVRVRTRAWLHVRENRPLEFFPLSSFLPFSLPVFNFFNSATQGGGKLISIIKHDRLHWIFKWDLRRAFSERKRNWSKDLSRISFPSPESKGKKYPKSSPDRTRFLDSSPRIFFLQALIGAFGKKKRAGKEKEERENWIAAFRKLEIATK